MGGGGADRALLPQLQQALTRGGCVMTQSERRGSNPAESLEYLSVAMATVMTATGTTIIISEENDF
jgi:hypothetical protein